MSSATAEQENKGGRAQAAPSFTVELGDEANRIITLDTFRLRLRGWWLKRNYYEREGGGRSIGELMNRMPDVPGIRLEVKARPPANPTQPGIKGTLRIYDPLAENEALLDKINAVLSGGDSVAIKNTGQRYGAWPEAVHELDEHQLKTLLMEIARKTHGKSPCMHATPGSTIPTVMQLQDFPGREIYDPWSNSSDKPTYVDQLDDWKDRLARQRSQVS